MNIGQWFSRIPQHLGNFFSTILPNNKDGDETKLYKRTVYIVFGMIFLVGFFGIAAFFLNLETEEPTMVPNVNGQDLVVAIEALQEKSLVPKVRSQLSTDPTKKGKIISQEPAGGLWVKVGRTVTIVVSKGVIATNLDNYIGRSFGVVKREVTTLLSGGEYVINLKDPIYISNPAPSGTILEQKPVAGTPITPNTELSFVVSSGPATGPASVPEFRGKAWQDALSLLRDSPVAFMIKVKKAEGTEVPGTIVAQSPAAGTAQAAGTSVLLTLAQPDKLDKDETFGVYEYKLEPTAIPADLKFEVKDKLGSRRTLLSMAFPASGGQLTLPYIAKKGDVLILSVFGKEVASQELGK